MIKVEKFNHSESGNQMNQSADGLRVDGGGYCGGGVLNFDWNMIV